MTGSWHNRSEVMVKTVETVKRLDLLKATIEKCKESKILE